MQGTPVIFLAFANDKQTASGFLRNLTQERNGIRGALKKASESTHPICELIVEPDASIDTIFDAFQDERYRDRIAIFHFGGHAEDYKLLLENTRGKTMAAHSEGLVPFLARQHSLQLVFLNGCSTESQADALVNAGIPAVIGTSGDIPDQLAQMLAMRFYQGIGAGLSLQLAWDDALHYIKSNQDHEVTSILYAHEDQHYAFPWHISYTKSSQRIQEWNLPDAAGDPIFGLPEIDRKYYLNLPDSPYLGLRRFERQHAGIFFGRNTETRKLIDKINGIHPVILYYGQSGAGKSSLLEAGLIPRIESSHTVTVVRRIKEKGLYQSLLTGLLDLLDHALPDAQDTDHAQDVLECWKAVEQTTGKSLVFILDQVEESYTKPLPAEQSEEEWKVFCTCISNLAEYLGQFGSGKLILSFRSDYLPQIQNMLSEAMIPKSDLHLLSISKSGIKEAMCGVTGNAYTREHFKLFPDCIAPELAEEIIHDLHTDQNSPVAPMLQILLAKLWERADITPEGRRKITRQAYRELRKEGIALSDHVDEQFAVLRKLNTDEHSVFYNTNVEESGLVLDLLMYFVTPRNSSDTLPVEDLALIYPHRKKILQTLIDHLVDVHLLSVFAEDGVLKVSLAHDTLAPVIRESYETSARAGQSARRILEAKGSIDELDLAQIEEGQSGMRAWTPGEDQAIQKSRAIRDKLKRQRRTRRILMWSAAVTIGIFGVAATLLGLSAKRNAFISRTHALSTQAQLVFGTDPTLGMNLALRAYSDVPDKVTGSSLSKLTSYHGAYDVANIVHSSQVQGVALSPDEQSILAACKDSTARLWTIDGIVQQVFRGHHGSLTSATFSPDGKYVLTGSEDHTAKLWTLDGTEIRSFTGHNQDVTSVAFSPDGKYILTGSRDSTAILWSFDGSEIREFTGHHHSVTVAVFSPDGTSILTGSEDGTAKLWSPDGTLIRTYQGHPQAIMSVAFSPDGKRILTGSEDNTARLWSIDGNLLQSYAGHTDYVRSVAFAPDGNSILTGSWDHTAKLWALDGNELLTFLGHNDFVSSVTFSRDGNYVLTGSWDKTVKRWAVHGTELRTFTGPTDIYTVAFSPDGKYVLTGGLDKAATLWTPEAIEVRKFVGHTAFIQSVAFSPDGRYVLTGSADATAKLWSREGAEQQSFVSHEDPVICVAFSPDGQTVLTGSWDHTAKLWDLKGNEIRTFAGHDHVVSAVAFSIDGKHVLTGSWDRTAKLWDLDGTLIQSYEGHTDYVWSVAFSPDNKYVLTGSKDGTAKLWTLSGTEVRSFVGHDGPVRCVVFSPGGQYILTGSGDHTAKLWTLDGIEIQTFAGHQDAVTSVVFSPDGKYVLTGSLDHTAKLWVRWDYIHRTGILAPLSAGQKAEYQID